MKAHANSLTTCEIGIARIGVVNALAWIRHAPKLVEALDGRPDVALFRPLKEQDHESRMYRMVDSAYQYFFHPPVMTNPDGSCPDRMLSIT